MRPKCFVIGRMSPQRIGTLHWLAEDVLARLLPDWDVETPDSSEIGNVMTHVIRSCDRATLVVADTTGNNPNVIYEVALLDALGRACLPVKIVDGDSGTEAAEPDLMPFDRAAYRFIQLYRAPERRGDTDKLLRRAIDAIQDKKSRGELYENPITDFYGVPLCALSSAQGLARGYYINLVKPSALSLPKAPIPDSAFDPARYATRELEIIIPDKLGHAGREIVDRLLERRIIRKVNLPAEGRPITLYEWADQRAPIFRWVDFPTTMASLRGNVFARLGKAASRDEQSPDFKALQQDEMDQFRFALKGQLDREDSNSIRDVTRLRDWRDKEALADV